MFDIRQATKDNNQAIAKGRDLVQIISCHGDQYLCSKISGLSTWKEGVRLLKESELENIPENMETTVILGFDAKGRLASVTQDGTVIKSAGSRKIMQFKDYRIRIGNWDVIEKKLNAKNDFAPPIEEQPQLDEKEY